MLAAHTCNTAAVILPAAQRPSLEVTILEEERRDSRRTRTVYRTVAVQCGSRRGLARLRNVSDGGMMLQTAMPMELGEQVTVAVTETTSVTGRVQWSDGDRHGLSFSASLDSMSLLSSTAAELRDPCTRAPRLPTSRLGVARGNDAPVAVQVVDVSQTGMKLAHKSRFTPGLPISVTMENGDTRRGVVRWNAGGHAGVHLIDTFRIEDLASV